MQHWRRASSAAVATRRRCCIRTACTCCLVLVFMMHVLMAMPWSRWLSMLLAVCLFRTMFVYLLPPGLCLRLRTVESYVTRGLAYCIVAAQLAGWMAAQPRLSTAQYAVTLVGSLYMGLRTTFGHMMPFKHHVLLQTLHLFFVLHIAPVVCRGVMLDGISPTAARLLSGMVAQLPDWASPVAALLGSAAFSSDASADGGSAVVASSGAAASAAATTATSPHQMLPLQQQCEVLTSSVYALCWLVVPTLLLLRYERRLRMQWWHATSQQRHAQKRQEPVDGGSADNSLGAVTAGGQNNLKTLP